MSNKTILKLALGFRKFREKYFDGEGALYNKLSTEGQSPKTLIIACSDSRVDPAQLASASPGEIFVVRNVANLVPPYESALTGFHGVSAAIEFAVVNLKVENVIILGHRQCGGIRSLVSGESQKDASFVGAWMGIALEARNRVLEAFAESDFETQCKQCEMEAIICSMANLKSFPFVADAIQNRQLNIMGIYFDLELGQLFEFNQDLNAFSQIKVD